MEKCLERLNDLRNYPEEGVAPDTFDLVERILRALYDELKDPNFERPKIFTDQDGFVQLDWVGWSNGKASPFNGFNLWVFPNGESHFNIYSIREVPRGVHDPRELARRVAPLLLNPPKLHVLAMYYKATADATNFKDFTALFKKPAEQYIVKDALDQFQRHVEMAGPLKFYDWDIVEVAQDPNSHLNLKGDKIFYVACHGETPRREDVYVVRQSEAHRKLCARIKKFNDRYI